MYSCPGGEIGRRADIYHKYLYYHLGKNMIPVTVVQDAVTNFPLSMADAARYVNVPFGTFKYYAIKYGLYSPNSSGKGRKLPNRGNSNRISLGDILQGRVEYKGGSSLLKKRLVAAGIKNNVCELCGCLPTHNGMPLVLQLDHINGDHYDNRLRNLRILCPNCHTQTPTHSRVKGVRKHRVITEVPVDEIVVAWEGSQTVTEVIERLGVNPRSSSVYRILKQYAPVAQLV